MYLSGVTVELAEQLRDTHRVDLEDAVTVIPATETILESTRTSDRRRRVMARSSRQLGGVRHVLDDPRCRVNLEQPLGRVDGSHLALATRMGLDGRRGRRQAAFLGISVDACIADGAVPIIRSA